MKKQPDLTETTLDIIFNTPSVIITMAKGQWDTVLESAYQECCTLLELDEQENPIRAYRKDDNHGN